MSISELENNIGKYSSVELVTIAQALHWFDDPPKFYQQVKWVLNKPNGIIAAWCYTLTNINNSVDSVFNKYYNVGLYWEPTRKLVDDKYKTIDFPFEPIICDNNNEFKIEKVMNLGCYFNYLTSLSAYQYAKEKGVELLTDDVVEKFTSAWSEDGKTYKNAIFPIYLRIGKVGASD